MTRRSPSHHLNAWIRLIADHDDQLTHLQLLWRRGGRDYRPLIPVEGFDSEQLTGAPWEQAELEDANLEWSPSTGESREECRNHIIEVTEQFWNVATRWTQAQGLWCDFKLVGRQHDTVLFEHGKRCAGPEAGDAAQPSRADGTKGDETPSNDVAERFADRERERRLNKRIEDFLDRMTQERDLSFETAHKSLEATQQAFVSVRESIDSAPRLISQASSVLQEAIEYQNEQVRQIKAQASGEHQLRAHAYSEMERSRRFGIAAELGKHMWETGVSSLLPLANRIVEVLADRDLTVFPEFNNAQQAMVYLVVTTTPHQLVLLFGDKKRAAAAMMGLLDEASRVDNERDALLHMAEAVRVLRSEEFRDVATAEQQLAARFLLGRLAMYRMSEFEEDNTRRARG